MNTEVQIPENTENNVYARNLKGDIIHVLKAPSGAQGYYCLGCDKDMQSVRQTIAYRMSFFRHVHNADQPERKCTYRDETYRHKLAKRILLQNLSIKVPPVYKYPPKGTTGLAMLLKESEIIKGHSVLPEVTVYGDEYGNIKWGSNIEVDEKYLVVRPDIVFFDNTGEPILLIELVATHGVNNEKKVKLRRLGINSIQVKIPKDSPEAIENAFNVTQNTKWIYNYDESNTQYFSVSETVTEGIPSIDENQRSLFEETFACRMSQTGNLIRGFDKCVESQYYREIEDGFRQEIRRVAANTDENQSRLDNIRAEHKKRVIDGLEPQVEELEREEEGFEREERDFQQYVTGLEARYESNKSELERKGITIDREIYGENEIDGGDGKTIEDRRREIFLYTSQLRKDIEKEDAEIGRIEQEEGNEIRRIEQEESGLSEYFRREAENLTKRFNSITTKEGNDLVRIERELQNMQGKFQSLEDELRIAIEAEEADLPREFGEEDERIEKGAEGAREQADKIVKSRISAGNTELYSRVRKLLDARGLYDDFLKTQILYRRYRKAYDESKDNSFENWVE